MYKVGDTVKVKTGLKGGCNYGYRNKDGAARLLDFDPDMECYCGNIFMVKVIDEEGRYILDLGQFKDKWRFTDSMLEPVNNIKAELQTGMVVEFKNKSRAVVFGDEAFGYDDHTYANLSRYMNDLHYVEGAEDEIDIEKIFRIDMDCGNLNNLLEDQNLTLLWERKCEEKEMTLDEIEKLVGCKVKIINNNVD